jgi:APA family basic amino acid/polyamine antiporter
VLGGIYSLLGANSAAELGAAVPRAGGFFVYANRAFGPFPAFVTGWADFLTCGGSAATSALLMSEYIGRLMPAAREGATPILMAVMLLAGFGWLQALGIRSGDRTQQITSAIKAILLLTLIISLLVSGARAPDTTPPQPLPASGLAFCGALVLAMQGIIYAYDGWYYPMYFGEEMQDPGREVPRAMLRGILIVAVIFVLINIAVLVVLPVGRLAGESLAMGAAMGVVFGARGDQVVALVALLALPSVLNASLMAATRILFAMARDGLVRLPVTRISTSGTPLSALWVTVVLAIAFLLTRTVERLLAIVSFFFVVNYLAVLFAVYVLRQREPDLPRPWRAWGHPWSTGILVAGSLAFLAGSVAADTRNSLVALACLVLSVPLFYLFRAPPARRES